MKEDKITSQDILEAVKNGFTSMDERLDKTDERLDKMEEHLDKTDERLDKMDGRIAHVGSQMVTKDYLDTKLLVLRGDLVVLLRKEDDKVKTLTDILLSKKVITKKDQEKIFSMEPFPNLALHLE